MTLLALHKLGLPSEPEKFPPLLYMKLDTAYEIAPRIPRAAQTTASPLAGQAFSFAAASGKSSRNIGSATLHFWKILLFQ